MYTQLKSLFVVSTTLISLTACALNKKGSNSRNSKCPQFSGNFTISVYQLYPENADFDFNSCVLYTGNLWNASVGIYDPYTTAYESIEFENITGNPDFFIGGVKMNHRTNLLSVTAYANKAFGTEGQDLSGTNYVMQWNPSTRQLHYKHNLTATTQGRFSGLQDVAHDPANNVYVIGTYPSSIVRVDPKGKKVQISSVSTVAAVLISTATFSAFVRAMNEILQHYRVHLTVGTQALVMAWLAVLFGWASTSFWLFSACSCPGRNNPHHRSNKGGLWSSQPSDYSPRSRMIMEKTGGPYEGVLNPSLAEDKDPLVTEYKGPASGKFQPYMHRDSE